MANKVVTSSLKHYGVKGMQWGKIKKDDKKKDKRTIKELPEAEPVKPEPRSRSSFPMLKFAEKNPKLAKRLNEQILVEISENRDNKIKDWKDVPRFNPKNESIKDALRKVNEGYILSPLVDSKLARYNDLTCIYTGDINDFSNNCPSTTMAYELRRRGYDVEAGITGGASVGDIAEVYGMTRDELNNIINNEGVPQKVLRI